VHVYEHACVCGICLNTHSSEDVPLMAAFSGELNSFNMDMFEAHLLG